MANVKVVHWRFEDGKPRTPTVLANGITLEHDPVPKGYYCWAYPDNNEEFESWMAETFGDNVNWTYRFNSGDPMYTVYIQHEKDAMLFKLRCNVNE